MDKDGNSRSNHKVSNKSMQEYSCDEFESQGGEGGDDGDDD